jgi:DNA-directed RNA polymerase specialized sigma subunit
LRAVERWLDGTNYSLGGGLADSFPLSRLFDELQDNLDVRQRTVLADRCSGKTLAEISTVFDVTRERVRQIETSAAQSLGDRILNELWPEVGDGVMG